MDTDTGTVGKVYSTVMEAPPLDSVFTAVWSFIFAVVFDVKQRPLCAFK